MTAISQWLLYALLFAVFNAKDKEVPGKDTSFYYCKLCFYANKFIILIFYSFLNICFRNGFDHG